MASEPGQGTAGVRRRAIIAVFVATLVFIASFGIAIWAFSDDDDPSPAPTATPSTATAGPEETATGDTASPTSAGDGQPGAVGLDDPYFPLLGNGGYDVHHYLLELRYDPETDELQGSATLTAVAQQDLSGFNLELSGLEVASVTVNGEEAEFARDGRELSITPGAALAARDGFEVRVTYSGVPKPIPSPFGDEIGWLVIDGGVAVINEPDGASTWYPVNDHPSDKASYTFDVTVPEGLEVAANGFLRETTTEGGWTSWRYEAEEPMASYLTTVGIGQFVFEEDETPGGTPIRNAFTEQLAEGASGNFSRTGQMMELFEGLFGPYPFDVYGALVVNINLNGLALETQTLSIFDSNFGRSEYGAEPTIAHELAHQWFGDSLTPATWQDIWLNEGFATYGQYLWIEEATGVTVDEQVREAYRSMGSRVTQPIPGDPGREGMFSGSVYIRGAFTLHALRLTIGDEAFFDTLRAYTATYAGANVTTADFIQVAEDVSSQDLQDLFDAWLYEDDLPELPES